MSDYTPTTGHILEAFAWDERYDGLDTEKMKQFDRWLAGVKAEAQFDCWLAGIKAQAWEEGYAAGDADAFTIDRLNTPNPYRDGEPE